MIQYPKLWGGTDAVGAGKVNSLRLAGLEFASSAVMPDSIARTKGNFSEVIAVPGGDGWYSSTNTSNSPIKIRSSGAGRGKFKAKGEAETELHIALAASRFIAATGLGWGFIILSLGDDGGITNYRAAKTTNGKSLSTRFLFSIVNTTRASLAGVSSVAGSFGNLVNFGQGFTFMPTGITYVFEDLTRARPFVRYIIEVGNGEIGTAEIDFSFIDNNKDYNLPVLTFLTYKDWIISISRCGELPKYWTSLNAGGSWTGPIELTACYPDIDIGGITAEAGGPEGQTAYLAQGAVKELMADGVALPLFKPISRRQVLVRTHYTYQRSPSIKLGATITLMDVTSGSSLAQWTFRDGGSNEFFDVFPMGQGAWAQFRYVPGFQPNPAIDQIKITNNYGASFVPRTLTEDIRFLQLNQGHYLPPNGPQPEVFPRNSFYVADVAGDKELWMSNDLFETSTKAATIAESVDAPEYGDYDFVSWVGNGQNPAPIDPTFPWRTDIRVGTPEWWYDGVEP